MDKLRFFTKEIKELGLTSVVYHAFCKLTRDPRKYLLYRQKRFSKFTPKQRRKHVEAFFNEIMPYKLNLDNPKTFCEKIQWLKLYDVTPLKTKLVDKYLVREYVAEKIGEEHLVPLIGVYDSFGEILFRMVPSRFVIKANHGTGMNIIVKDKSQFDSRKGREIADFWMETNFAYSGYFEMQYRDIPPKILIEEYLEQSDGNLYDYKIHCFNGKPHCIQLIGDRNLKEHTGRQVFLDPDYNKEPFNFNTYPEYSEIPAKPDNWEELLDIAAKLAEPFNYVRVDLYSVNGKIYFGEMTFTPASGIYPNWEPRIYDEKWGQMIELPKKSEEYAV